MPLSIVAFCVMIYPLFLNRVSRETLTIDGWQIFMLCLKSKKAG